MTPKLLRELKAVNFSCTSPDSAAIHHESILMTEGIGGRAIDRFSPHLRDPLRSKPLHNNFTSKKNTSGTNTTSPTLNPTNYRKISGKITTTASASPASSQRYLLSSDTNSESFFHDPVEPAPSSSVTVKKNPPSRFPYVPEIEVSSGVLRPFEQLNDSGSSSASSSSSSSSSRPQPQQVVVLRVSLHCKGCEGKVRKHISKMEGVTSFTTDLMNKKVTVVGNVTPLGVLNSISKVKNAQLWQSQPPRTSSSVY